MWKINKIFTSQWQYFAQVSHYKSHQSISMSKLFCKFKINVKLYVDLLGIVIYCSLFFCFNNYFLTHAEFFIHMHMYICLPAKRIGVNALLIIIAMCWFVLWYNSLWKIGSKFKTLQSRKASLRGQFIIKIIISFN